MIVGKCTGGGVSLFLASAVVGGISSVMIKAGSGVELLSPIFIEALSPYGHQFLLNSVLITSASL